MSRLLHPADPMPVLSLGAGVQSSALALMFSAGEIPGAPELAIFADTQAEPRAVYSWLNWLEPRLAFPVVRVTAGNLANDSTRVWAAKSGNRYLRSMVPAYILREGGKGMAMRHCTMNHKIDVIHRELRRRRNGRPVVQYLGISLDEVHRMKPAKPTWLTNAYPLVDLRRTRNDCLRWMHERGFPRPPRSACTFCPYHSDAEWRRLKAEAPEDFQAAVDYEQRLQRAYAGTSVLQGVPFLHSSRTPLEQAVFNSSATGDLFGNECEGMCGV